MLYKGQLGCVALDVVGVTSRFSRWRFVYAKKYRRVRLMDITTKEFWNLDSKSYFRFVFYPTK
jgi:hypothetical protein